MKRYLLVAGLFGIAVALSGCMGTTTTGAADWKLNDYVPDPNANTTAQTTVTADASFKTLINGVRTGEGVQSLTWNATLDKVAQSYAGYLVDTGQFDHDAGNSTIGERVTASGYQWAKVGENLAQGQPDENTAMTAWRNSPGHNENMIDPDFEDFALGVSGTGSDITWVLVLAQPR